MPPENQYLELKKKVENNEKLLTENNELLRKMYRNSRWAFWLRLVWYALLIGLPFALYFYVLEPYFEALGSSYEVFQTGMQEIPGWKQFIEASDNFRATPD